MKGLALILAEAVAIVALGCALGLGANSLRNRSALDLHRDYFSKAPIPGASPSASQPASAHDPITPPPSGERNIEDIIRELQARGVQVIRHEEVVALFNDPLYQAGAFIFIDARDDEHYAEGHIPGARHLFRFWSSAELDRAIQEVRPVLDNAQRIVVYCGGGECEDSEATARDLLTRGVDPNRLFVYPEGFRKWMSENLPVEQGAAAQ